MTPAGRRIIVAVVAPIQRFFSLEASSGILLLASAVVALAWANSPLHGAYQQLFDAPFALKLGGHTFQVDAQQVISEGLMTFFFFLVGMEIKREMVEGELRSVDRALLPAVAALGGMVVPASIFFAVAAGTAGAHGWGIPMATDIAFCIGALRLLRRRVPRSLLVFITALAIFDDVGGILVIAFFYGHGLRPLALAVAAGVATGLFLAGRAGIRRGIVYALGGVVLWLALQAGGIHPTIAGVITGLAVPGRTAATAAMDGEPPIDRFIRLWHPWVAFGLMPLFALSSSGVRFAADGASSVGRVTLAAAAGLFFGKQAGIFGATFLAVKLGLGKLPRGASWRTLFGVALVAGIGFTVALFMAELAFPHVPSLLDQARVGIIGGSLASALVGVAVLRSCPPVEEE